MTYTFYGEKTRAANANEIAGISNARIYEGRICARIEADTRTQGFELARAKFSEYESLHTGIKIGNLTFREGDHTVEATK